MCRLMGYVSLDERPLVDVIGQVQCGVWQGMGRVHTDGWGSAWLPQDAGSAPEITKGIGSGDRDPLLTEQMLGLDSHAGLFHLRWASAGIPIELRNTHPFLADGMAFAHNGTIFPQDGLIGLLDERSLGELLGSTDSEKYFALIRQKVRTEGLPLAEAAAASVAEIRGLYSRSSMNALLLTPTEFIAISAAGGIALAPEALAEATLVPEEDWPADHTDRYYDFWMLPGDRSIAFSSSGIANDGWIRVTDTVTAVDIATLAVRQIPVPSPILA